MADPYANISELGNEKHSQLAEALQLRAEDPEMQYIIDMYLSEVPFEKSMKVLDVGCGTGAITRKIASKIEEGKIVGIDPSEVFLEKAKELSVDFNNIKYQQGDGRNLSLKESSFDVVVIHTVLSHMPTPEDFLREAYRVLKPGGYLVVFDGDYSLRSVSLGKYDPLQSCIEIMKEYNCHDIWLVRKLPILVRNENFCVIQFRSHGYIPGDPSYMLNFLKRGAKLLVEDGYINEKTAHALMEEANSRVDNGSFFGFIPFASIIAQK